MDANLRPLARGLVIMSTARNLQGQPRDFASTRVSKTGLIFLENNWGTWWEIDGQDEELKEKERKPGVLAPRIVPSELMGFVSTRSHFSDYRGYQI
jgi:hypothetical protein